MPYSEGDRIRDLVKVDPLIFVGGISLAFITGFVNAVSLCYFHVPVSHMTGAVSRLSIDLASLNFSELVNLSYIVFGFLFGAILTGMIIGARNFKAGIEYSVILALESLALCASYFLFESGANPALFSAAFACGLQNAMASNYLVLIIRTTHLTGIMTDLVVLIGQALKHKQVRFWKIGFLVSILLRFFSGGLMGFSAFRFAGYYSIFFPASMCMTGGIGFYFFRVRKPTPTSTGLR
jgi:uncharacterized membrane protein YoaK (UPF0700 family)